MNSEKLICLAQRFGVHLSEEGFVLVYGSAVLANQAWMQDDSATTQQFKARYYILAPTSVALLFISHLSPLDLSSSRLLPSAKAR